MSKAIKAAIIVAGIATGVGILTAGIAGGAGFAAFGLTLNAGTIGAFFARQFVTSLVLGVLSSALTKSPSGGVGGTTVTGRNSLAPRQVIYGRTRVGGTIVYMEGTDSNKYLHTVIALTGHEVDAIEKVYFNDEEVVFDVDGNVTTGSYANRVRIKTVLGTADQLAFSDLVAESDGKWTADHRMRGCAALYVRLEYDQDKFPSGVPNVSALIRGKKVYDPRTNSTVWSQNPALCLNDYLTSTEYGIGCSYLNEIDISSLIAAANICDEDVPLVGGGTENAYEINGAFQTSTSPEQVINSILSSMIGKAVWSGGKWRILAGAYYTPTLAFDEGDMRGGIKVQTNVSRRENFNSVKGTHVSIAENYIPTDFPPVIGDGSTNATMANYVAQDNDEIVYKTIVLPFTTSATMAQRIAKIELERARQQITVSLPLKLVGLKANVGDVILLDNDRMGWVQKPFEVVSMGITYTEELGVDLELRETAAEVFNWNSGIDQKDYDPAPNTNLPNPFNVTPPTNLVVAATSQVNNDGTVQPLFQVTWTASVDQSVINYEIQWKRGAYGSLPAETQFNSALLAGVSYTISGVITEASYEIRVRSVNSLGVRSAWLSTSGENNIGDTSPPAIPTSLTAVGAFRQIKLSWINPTDPDFASIEIYRNSSNNSGTASKIAVASTNSFTDTGLGISETWYYWVKSVDYSGNVSGFSTVATGTSAFIDNADYQNGIYQLFKDQGLYAIRDVTSLPVSGDFVGEKIFNRTDGKLYQWTGSAWNSLVADANIPAGSITATEIADNAISTPKLAANAVTAAKISASTITGDKIAANTITGGLISSSGIITNTAQINDGLITNAKIQNLAVTTLKIGDNAVTIPESASHGEFASNGVQVFVLTKSFFMTYPGSVVINYTAIIGYDSGLRATQVDLILDNLPLIGSGTVGVAYAPYVAFSATVKNLAAGSHTVKVGFVAGDTGSTCRINNGSLTILGVQK